MSLIEIICPREHNSVAKDNVLLYDPGFEPRITQLFKSEFLTLNYLTEKRDYTKDKHLN